MTDISEPPLIEQLKARLIADYYTRTDYLVRLGCQVCYGTATFIGHGPTQVFTAEETPDGVTMRLTETLFIRCADHAPDRGEPA